MQDFLQACVKSVPEAFSDVKLFQDVYCAHCRNGNCRHARWFNTDKFAQRVATQFDRLLNPVQVEGTHPKHAVLKDFVDMLHAAQRLEIADRRGDWEIVPDLTVPSEPSGNLTPAVEELPRTTTEAAQSPVRIPPRPGNTEMPDEGIMVGGGPPPRSTAHLVMPAVDPWDATSKIQIVKPGTKIVLGEKHDG